MYGEGVASFELHLVIGCSVCRFRDSWVNFNVAAVSNGHIIALTSMPKRKDKPCSVSLRLM